MNNKNIFLIMSEKSYVINYGLRTQYEELYTQYIDLKKSFEDLYYLLYGSERLKTDGELEKLEKQLVDISDTLINSQISSKLDKIIKYLEYYGNDSHIVNNVVNANGEIINTVVNSDGD